MNWYKRGYYKIFIGLCDILEEIEKIEEEKGMSEEIKERLKAITEKIKLIHIDAEDEIIREKSGIKRDIKSIMTKRYKNE